MWIHKDHVRNVQMKRKKLKEACTSVEGRGRQHKPCGQTMASEKGQEPGVHVFKGLKFFTRNVPGPHQFTLFKIGCKSRKTGERDISSTEAYLDRSKGGGGGSGWGGALERDAKQPRAKQTRASTQMTATSNNTP